MINCRPKRNFTLTACLIIGIFISLSFNEDANRLGDQYNSLRTGATPYAHCYGKNASCSSYGCSEIKVKAPLNSDVMVTVKKNRKVIKHAYIRRGSYYTFQVKNGSYQTFFYYGYDWDPNKVMKTGTTCGTIKGGFRNGETFGKDDPVYLSNQQLYYELILQQNGNFSTKPSNKYEAF